MRREEKWRKKEEKKGRRVKHNDFVASEVEHSSVLHN